MFLCLVYINVCTLFHVTAVDCGLLLSPLNGQVLLLQGTVFGASAMYNCDEGFVLLGVTVRRCEANGEWSATEPTCSRKYFDLGSLNNGCFTSMLCTISCTVCEATQSPKWPSGV